MNLLKALCLLALWNTLVFGNLSEVDQCIYEIHKSKIGNNISRSLGGIVGIGWDDLTSRTTLPVFDIRYTKCKTVPDGDFLIPDNVYAFPKKNIVIDKSATTHDSYSSVASSDTLSISASAGGGAGMFSAKASFSMENQQAKKHMSKAHSKMYEQAINYYAYDVVVNENEGFDPAFQFRLEDVAQAVVDKDLYLASYRAQEIINDYGTHVVNKAKIGAMVSLRTFVEFSSEEDEQTNSQAYGAGVEASAGSFFSAKLEVNNKHQESQVSNTSDSKSTTKIITRGGPDVNRLLSSDEKPSLNIDSLVGLNQEGHFLYSMIHTGVLDSKKFNFNTIQIVQDLIYNATIEYYEHNTIPGCTQPGMRNFNFRANVDDGTCSEDPITTQVFGGSYQTCEYLKRDESANLLAINDRCLPHRAPNPITEGASCPPGYENVTVDVMYLRFEDQGQTEKLTECNLFWKVVSLGRECTQTLVNDVKVVEAIKVETHWCRSYQSFDENAIKNKYPTNEVLKNRVLFGGIFKDDNIFSDTSDCPIGYSKLPFLNDLWICQSKQKTRSTKVEASTAPPVAKPIEYVQYCIPKEVLPRKPYPPDVKEVKLEKCSEEYVTHYCKLKKSDGSYDLCKIIGNTQIVTKDSFDLDAPYCLKSDYTLGICESQESSSGSHCLISSRGSSSSFGGSIFSAKSFSVGFKNYEISFYPCVDASVILMSNEIPKITSTRPLKPQPPDNESKSVHFGGILTCRSNSTECPEGFSKYLATTVGTCPVWYCARVDSSELFMTPPKLHRPPYISRQMAFKKTRSTFEKDIDILVDAKDATPEPTTSTEAASTTP